MELRYSCLSERYKKPFGCLRQNELCRMMVEISEGSTISKLEIVLCTETGYGLRVSFTPEGSADGFVRYCTEFSLPRHDLYFYYFHIESYAGPSDWYRVGDEGTAAGHGDLWQITCYPSDFQTPAQFRGAVTYQIFPDRFFRGKDCNLTGKLEPYWIHENWHDNPHFLPDEHGEILNNDFFGGNLDGICQKLNYLKSLNVEVIYLNPICMGYSNHRYDTADYRRIDPMLGTNEDFIRLCNEAHALGMKVILDGVYSHTGSNSVYFDKKGVFGSGAYNDPSSPFRSWYDFQQYPDKYTSWWGIDTLPCVNEMDPSYLNYIIHDEDSVIAHWLALGADGFRLDVADELPDAFIAAFRARIKAIKPDAILMGEVWEDASNKIAYSVRRRYFSDGELDSVMNYPFRNAILGFMADGNSRAFQSTVINIVEHYPAPIMHCVLNSLSTHDTPRMLTLLGAPFGGSKAEKAGARLYPEDFEKAVSRGKTAAVLQYTLPGMACIYYGDEAGLEGFEDPFNRRCYPWGRAIEELIEFYRLLGKLKSGQGALRTGEIRFLPAPDGVICYRRTLGDQHVTVWVNGSETPMPLAPRGTIALEHNCSHDKGCLVLKQWGAAIVLEED